MKRAKILGLLAVLAMAGESCADLPTLAANQCGNGVVDPGEDCDSFPSGACRPPGDPNACRFDCSACPSGWGCDVDEKICRKPVGAFSTTATTSFEATTARLELADFDGDGRQDVIAHAQADASGRETVRVFYFDGAGPPAKSVTLGASAISPVVLDINRDGKRADLMFAAAETGINVMLGAADRTLAPIAFPRFPFPPGSSARLVRVNGMELPLEVKFVRAVPIIFAELAPGENLIALATTQSGDPKKNALAALDRPAGKMVGEPIASNIVDGPGRECEEVIWAWQGEGALQWIETCTPGNLPFIDPTRRPNVLFTLPGGDKIQRTPVAVDLNSDGHADLLVEGELNAYVAFGRGDGTFSAKPDLSVGSGELSTIECAVRNVRTGMPLPAFRCGAPLAAYAPAKKVLPNEQTLVAFPLFILATRKIAAVAPGGVLIEGIAVARPGGTGWSVARFDDFNGNGYVDVVAASDNASDIEFFNGTSTELFNPGRIRTDSPVRNLSSGDYDGDLINDLGFVEIGAGGPTIDGISVAYGNYAGVPEAPLRLGVFPNVIQAQTAKAAGFDETLQLGIIYKGEGNTDLIAILEGGGDRQLLSPFALAAIMGEDLVTASPFVVAAGDYDGDTKVDAISFGYDQVPGSLSRGPLRAWFVKGRGDGRFMPPSSSEEIKSLALDSLRRIIATAKSANLNDDPRDEAVILGVDPSGTKALLSTISLKGSVAQISPSLPVANVPASAIGRLDLELADLDGDGKIDAIFTVHASKSVAQVAWGRGDGTFDVAGATVVDLGADTTRPRAIAAAQLDTDAARELLVSTGEATYRVEASGHTLSVVKILPPADAIAAGDINGDGLPDIALAKDHRVSIYPGVSR